MGLSRVSIPNWRSRSALHFDPRRNLAFLCGWMGAALNPVP